MRIVDYLPPGVIAPDLAAPGRDEALRELVALIARHEPDLDPDEAFRALRERERLGSTGVGDGVAIPHAKVPGLRRILAAFGRSLAGIDFDSIDAKPAHLFFAILAPDNSVGAHLSLLARISRVCQSPGEIAKLREAVDAATIRRIIDLADQTE
ncbi:MAG: PTS sugar transporter subunit IIA [Deltaproteobacteria bacterium]|nr:PTS sugar transporter subunit IIA [Deltaproteobacteria bacterium]